MNPILSNLRPALVMTGLFVILTGVAYPLLVTGVAGVALPNQANGSLIRDGAGQVRGSALIAQSFAGPGYLHPRPSAAGDKGYDASNSSGSNLGPMDKKLIDRVAGDVKTLAGEGPGPIAPDALTTSGSGLDPDISPENAARQVARIAAARHLTVGQVTAVIRANTEGAALGFIGQPRVNVLKTNLALDKVAKGS